MGLYRNSKTWKRVRKTKGYRQHRKYQRKLLELAKDRLISAAVLRVLMYGDPQDRSHSDLRTAVQQYLDARKDWNNSRYSRIHGSWSLPEIDKALEEIRKDRKKLQDQITKALP